MFTHNYMFTHVYPLIQLLLRPSVLWKHLLKRVHAIPYGGSF